MKVCESSIVQPMKKYICLTVLMVFSNLSNLAPTLAKTPSVIGKIQDMTEVGGGGCLVWKGSDTGNIIFWTTDNQEVLMNINGQDLKLKLVNEKRSMSSGLRGQKGDRWISVYRSGNIIVKLTRITTRLCRPGDMECESTGYAATINLQNGKHQETIKANAECGS
jgi:hypothetical protein